MAQFLRRSVVADWWQFVRRYVPYSALALCCLATSVTAGERFGQWSLEFQEEGVVALKLKPNRFAQRRIWSAGSGVRLQSREQVRRSHDRAKSGDILEINRKQFPLRSKNGKRLGLHPDLLQQWDNEGDYIFAEQPDELDKFTSYLKAQEADGIKSVYFYFPNDLVTGAGKTNQVVIDLSGFSKGMQHFEKECDPKQWSATKYGTAFLPTCWRPIKEFQTSFSSGGGDPPCTSSGVVSCCRDWGMCGTAFPGRSAFGSTCRHHNTVAASHPSRRLALVRRLVAVRRLAVARRFAVVILLTCARFFRVERLVAARFLRFAICCLCLSPRARGTNGASTDRTATMINSLNSVEFLPSFVLGASGALQELRCDARFARRTLSRIAGDICFAML